MKKIEGNNFIVNHSSLVIDGGNIVIGEIGLPNSYTTQSFIVMTDKVMRENEGLSQKEIETQIQDSFKPKECNSDYDDITIVWLPWDPKDICGHTDGILRFVDINKDGKAVVLANLSVYDDDIDNIIGILHIRDLLKVYVKGSDKDKKLYQVKNQVMFDPFCIPETRSIRKCSQRRIILLLLLMSMDRQQELLQWKIYLKR